MGLYHKLYHKLGVNMAWQYRKALTTKNMNGVLVGRLCSEEDDGYVAWARMHYRRYNVDDQECFFCGKRGAKTGFLPGLGSVWQCKEGHKDYKELCKALGS